MVFKALRLFFIPAVYKRQEARKCDFNFCAKWGVAQLRRLAATAATLLRTKVEITSSCLLLLDLLPLANKNATALLTKNHKHYGENFLLHLGSFLGS